MRDRKASDYLGRIPSYGGPGFPMLSASMYRQCTLLKGYDICSVRKSSIRIEETRYTIQNLSSN